MFTILPMANDGPLKSTVDFSSKPLKAGQRFPSQSLGILQVIHRSENDVSFASTSNPTNLSNLVSIQRKCQENICSWYGSLLIEAEKKVSCDLVESNSYETEKTLQCENGNVIVFIERNNILQGTLADETLRFKNPAFEFLGTDASPRLQSIFVMRPSHRVSFSIDPSLRSDMFISD